MNRYALFSSELTCVQKLDIQLVFKRITRVNFEEMFDIPIGFSPLFFICERGYCISSYHSCDRFSLSIT